MEDDDHKLESQEFMRDLEDAEELRESEARVIAALRQQGIFIDLGEHFRIGDKAIALMQEAKRTKAEMEDVATQRPKVEEMEQVAPHVFIDSSEASRKYNELAWRHQHLERQVAIATHAEIISIVIVPDGEEEYYSVYPFASDVSYSPEYSYPTMGQLDETEAYGLHGLIARIPNDRKLMLDDRRALLATIESLVGTETYMQAIQDIFRTERPADSTPNIISI